MKKLLVLFALVVASFSASLTAQADTITLTGLNGTTQGGYQVGPASGTVNGTPISMVCNDFSHHVKVGQTWTATISTFDNLSGGRFASLPGAVAKYQQAAWLFDQFATNPASMGDIQFAIWSLFTPSTPSTAGALSWLNLASNQNLTNYNFSSFRIFTPTDPSASSPQEFIAKLPGSEVPEPASLVLLGSGLAGIAQLLRKRKDKENTSDK